jgi:hypothetical protein
LAIFGDTLSGPIYNGLRRFNIEHETMDERLRKLNTSLETYDTVLPRLLDKYHKLKGEAENNTEKQAELHEVIQRIVEIVPQAANGFNALGEALDISAGALQEYIKWMRELNEEQRKLEELKIIGLITQTEARKRIAEDKAKLENLDAEKARREEVLKIEQEIERIKNTPERFVYVANREDPIDVVQVLEEHRLALLAQSEAATTAAGEVQKYGQELDVLKQKLDALTKSSDPIAMDDALRATLSMGKHVDTENPDVKQFKKDIEEIRKITRSVKEENYEAMRVAINQALKLGVNGVKTARDMMIIMTGQGYDDIANVFSETWTKIKNERKTFMQDEARDQLNIIADFMKNVMKLTDMPAWEEMTNIGKAQFRRMFDTLPPAMQEAIKKAADKFEHERKTTFESRMEDFKKMLELDFFGEDGLGSWEKEIDRIYDHYVSKFGEIDKVTFTNWFTSLSTGMQKAIRDAAIIWKKEFVEEGTEFFKLKLIKGFDDVFVTIDELYRSLGVNPKTGYSSRGPQGVSHTFYQPRKGKGKGKVDEEISNLKLLEEKFFNFLDRLIDGLKSKIPHFGAAITEFLDSILTDLTTFLKSNDDGERFDLIGSLKKGMPALGASAAIGFGSLISSKILGGFFKLFGGGKSLYDVVIEQRKQTERLKGIEESLRGSATMTQMEKALAHVGLILGKVEHSPVKFDKTMQEDYARLIGRYGDILPDMPSLEELMGMDWEDRLEFFRKLFQKLREGIDDFGRFQLDTLPEIIANWELLADAMNIEDAILRWHFFIDLLKKGTDDASKNLGEFLSLFKNPADFGEVGSLLNEFFGRGGLNAKTDEDKARVQYILERLAQLSGLTLEELSKYLADLNLTADEQQALLKAIQDNGEAASEAFKEIGGDTEIGVSRNVTITQQQGDTIIAVLNTINFLMGKIVDKLDFVADKLAQVLGSSERIGGGTLTPTADAGAAGGLVFNIANINIYANSAEGGVAASKAFARDAEQRLRSMGIKVVGQKAR